MLSSSPVIGQRFAFAHGRTGVLQQSLLSQSDIDRLLGTHDSHEAQQVLTELRFTKLIDQSLRDADAIVRACEQWVRREVTVMCPKDKQPVFNILWLEGDLPVLAYLLKKQKGMTSGISMEPQSAYHVFARASLVQLIEQDVVVDLPEELVACIRSIRSSKIDDPRVLDARISQFGADMRKAYAAKSGSKPILRFVTHLIDLQNIRTVLRFPKEERGAATLHLLNGGSIKPSLLTSAATTVAAQVRIAGFYHLANAIEQPLHDINCIEQALDDILAEDIAVMWNVILSIEPLFAFAALSLAQIRLLRAIIIGKRNALSPQEIKKMLPAFLSASHYVL